MNADDLAEDDPWAPLPPDRLVLRPGEVEPAPAPCDEAVQRSQQPTGPTQPDEPRTRPPSTPPSPEALAKLAELQQRCAEAGSGDSLVSRFERRRLQQRRVDRMVARDDEARAVSADGEHGQPAAPADGAAASVTASPVSPDPDLPTHDPREDEAWFQQLPESERKRLHDVWAHKRDAAVCGERVERRSANHRMVQAWVCFAATIVLGQGFGWHATIGAGIVCGIWWRHAPPDRLLDPVRALVCLIVLQALAMAVAEEVNPGLGLDAVILISIAAVVGFDGEIRRTGMFDGRPGPRRGA